jgi:hypothetical protein
MQSVDGIMLMAKKVDANQSIIVFGLRQFGASVWDLHTVGHGPDILVGYRNRSYPMEIKSESGTLTPDEVKWRDNWKGNYYIVRTIEQALQILCDDCED